MAKAVKTTVEKVTTVKEERVTLTLSRPEAETLALLVRVVGGRHTTTRRGHTEAISKALAEQDIKPSIGQTTARLTGSATFKDEPDHDRSLPLPSLDPMVPPEPLLSAYNSMFLRTF